MEASLYNYVNSRYFKDSLRIMEHSKIELELLGRGEYNINYVFSHPDTGRKLVLRINTTSQMNLENQIEYEYKALKVLEATGRTPAAYFVDGSKAQLQYGVLVMEYLNGRKLDYDRDMDKAAAIFADIHSCNTESAGFLVKPQDSAGAMIDECVSMAGVYLSSDIGNIQVKKRIEKMLEKASNLLQSARNTEVERRIINTEVNSGNFIINDNIENCYLIDWEKPILGEPAQDLAHFIVPTTTYWKTDKILTIEEQDKFIKCYIKHLDNRIDSSNIADKVRLYLPLNCLRGITWCSMAWVQYNDENKLIKNEDTYKKINDYLNDDFLDMIESRYFSQEGI